MSDFNFELEPTQVPKVSTANRRIETEIPAPGTASILDKLENFESRSMHGQIPLVWDKAEDFSVFDHAGNKWIDFTSTIFVANVGHANPRVCEAIQAAVDDKMIACYAYPNSTRALYLERLIKFAGANFQKAFLLSAGTEATEAALKLMKLFGRKKGKRRNLVVAISGNWHGRTLGAQIMSNNQMQRDWISNYSSETVHISFPFDDDNNLDAKQFLKDSMVELESQGIDIKHDVCGFMLETFQGWGAVFYPVEYVKAIRELCDSNDILLTFDEMQAGFGRTGKNFGYEHYEVRADLICCGKGMGGGLPISGVIGSAEVMDLPDIGNMSSTHSGNPLLSRVGIAVLEEIESKNLVKESERKGRLLHSKLNDLLTEFPTDVNLINGKGLIAAVIFKDKYKNEPEKFKISKIAEKCFQKGLLVVHTGRESIKIGPPLTITDDAIIEGVEVLHEAMRDILSD